MKKRLLTTILATSMVLGLAACGNSGPVPTASGDSQQTTETPAATTEAPAAQEQTAEASADAVPGIDGFTPFADKVTLRVAVYDRGDNGNGCSELGVESIRYVLHAIEANAKLVCDFVV